MDRRTLQMIQRGLIAAVSFVLAMIVITAFMNVLETPDDTLPLRATTSTIADDGDTTTTTTIAPAASAATTTSTTAGATDDVCAEEMPADEDSTILRVFFPCGGADPATGGTFVYRAVAPTDLVLTSTLREMTKGLERSEAELGFNTPFPAGADGSFLGVSLAEGTAFLEFNADIFPGGVDTAEGAQIFLSTLNANVFQFSSIDEVEYRLGGSCAAFWLRLGAEECDTITRAEWQSSQLAGG